MVDSVNLYAANLYGKVQNQQIIPTTPDLQTPTINATAFQEMVNVNFNNFAKLSPSEILDRVSAARIMDANRGPAVRLDLNNTVVSELSKLRDVLKKQETQSQKAAIGEANLIDLMTASTQAEMLLTSIVSMRDELKGAWDKIWNMSL